jgi:hypothetical protein
VDAIALLDRKNLDSSTARKTVSMGSFDCRYDVGRPSIIRYDFQHHSGQMDFEFVSTIYRDPIPSGAILMRPVYGYTSACGDQTRQHGFTVLERNDTSDQFQHQVA